MPRSGSGMKRQVVLFISRDEWRVLTALAEAAERDQYQQARFMLREALAAAADPRAEPERVAV